MLSNSRVMLTDVLIASRASRGSDFSPKLECQSAIGLTVLLQCFLSQISSISQQPIFTFYYLGCRYPPRLFMKPFRWFNYSYTPKGQTARLWRLSMWSGQSFLLVNCCVSPHNGCRGAKRHTLHNM